LRQRSSSVVTRAAVVVFRKGVRSFKRGDQESWDAGSARSFSVPEKVKVGLDHSRGRERFSTTVAHIKVVIERHERCAIHFSHPHCGSGSELENVARGFKCEFGDFKVRRSVAFRASIKAAFVK
jgi:hypothetical protein